MERIGDPVLDYIEDLINFIQKLGVDWRMPKNFNQYPEDDQRDYLWSLQEAYAAIINGNPPTPPSDIMCFILGGPRPPITG